METPLSFVILPFAISSIHLSEEIESIVKDDVMLKEMLPKLEEAKWDNRKWLQDLVALENPVNRQAKNDVDSLTKNTFNVIDEETKKYQREGINPKYHNENCLRRGLHRLRDITFHAFRIFDVCNIEEARQFQSKFSRDNVVGINSLMFVIRDYLTTCFNETNTNSGAQLKNRLKCTSESTGYLMTKAESLIESSLAVKGSNAEIALNRYWEQLKPCYVPGVELVLKYLDGIIKDHKTCLDTPPY